MSDHFEKVKTFLQNLDLPVIRENPAEELVVVSDPDSGITNLVIDCEYPILILEQVLFAYDGDDPELFRELLARNRSLIHGAFCLDPENRTVIFRDTLQMENLDLNELEGSINALRLALVENLEFFLHHGSSTRRSPKNN
jgi:hypothetical protein